MSSTFMRQIALLTVTLIGAAAWGSSTDTGNAGGNGGCTVTLSGAQAASLGCSDASIGWSAPDNATGFSIPISGPPQVIISGRLPGQPATKTYHSSDGAVVLGLVVSDGTNAWGTGVSGTTINSATLRFTSLRTTISAAKARTYEAHGTITATLAPDPSTPAAGTVTVNATF